MPVGWDWWAGLLGNSKYYDYSLSINGTERLYGNDSSDYLTDVIVSMTILELQFTSVTDLDPRRAFDPSNDKARDERITVAFVYCRVAWR